MSFEGIWEIFVLPSAGYLVRYAKFTANGNARLEVNTYGLQQNAECVFPDKAEIKIPLGSAKILYSFYITSAKLKFDSVLYEQVQKDFDAEMPKESVKIDTTSGKEVVQVIGGEEPVEFEIPQKSSGWTKTIVVICVNTAGILLLLYIYFRNRRKK